MRDRIATVVEDLYLVKDGLSFPHGLGEMKIELQVVGGKSGGAGIDLLHDCGFTSRKIRHAVGGGVPRTVWTQQRRSITETSTQAVLRDECHAFTPMPDFPEDGWAIVSFLVEQDQAEPPLLGLHHYFDLCGIIRHRTNFENWQRLFCRQRGGDQQQGEA